MLEIKKLSINHAQELFNSEEFSNMHNVPISYKRLQSYLNNPKKDILFPVLYLGFTAQNLLAYRSLLQTKILERDVVMVWLSGVWVNPADRRNGLAKKLLNEVYKDYSGYIFSTNLGANSLRLIQENSQFEFLKNLEGFRFFYRFPLAEVLPPKSKLYLKLKPILRLIDKFANWILDLRLLFYKNYSKSNIEVAELNDQLKEFISRHNQNSLFKRNVEEFKWILEYPWVEQREHDNEWDSKYHFTTSAKRFYQKALVYKTNEEIKGFIFYSVKNEVLKIHYHFSDSDLELNEFVTYILSIIRHEKISYMMLTDQQLIQKFKKKGGYIFSKVWKKGFYAGKKLLEDFPEIKEKDIYMGDGDTVFM